MWWWFFVKYGREVCEEGVWSVDFFVEMSCFVYDGRLSIGGWVWCFNFFYRVEWVIINGYNRIKCIICVLGFNSSYIFYWDIILGW